MRSFIMSKISRQLTLALLLSLALVSGLYIALQPILSGAICRYYETNPSITQEKTKKILSSLQNYVQVNNVSPSDTEKLSQWVKKYPLTILHVYRHEAMLYDSTLFTSSGLHTHTTARSLFAHESVYYIVFSDGTAFVSITIFPEYGMIQMMNIGLLLICGLIFLGIMLLCIRKELLHFTRLEQDVLSIAGGSLHTSIRVQGQDELASLSECIEEMRRSLVAKLRQEEARQQESYEWVTALSHDFRTPLTMLTGYLEIIRRQSQAPTQQAYADKACRKATQLKEMSDLLFACFSPNALQNDARICLPTAYLEELLGEWISLLTKEGYTVRLHDMAPSCVLAHQDALRRVMDNVFSNLSKYADPLKPIDISAYTENNRYTLTAQSTSHARVNVQSAGLGLNICKNLMANMRGNFITDQRGDQFFYCIEWEIADPLAETASA
ncbi:MAG: HAMP domain-containing histidine kinase [Firmicutes bacterium]|nr:HAMP domain-containing histidine kinase [Bacillota bacterium]